MLSNDTKSFENCYLHTCTSFHILSASRLVLSIIDLFISRRSREWMRGLFCHYPLSISISIHFLPARKWFISDHHIAGVWIPLQKGHSSFDLLLIEMPSLNPRFISITRDYFCTRVPRIGDKSSRAPMRSDDWWNWRSGITSYSEPE